jgi:hypothetical protein
MTHSAGYIAWVTLFQIIKHVIVQNYQARHTNSDYCFVYVGLYKPGPVLLTDYTYLRKKYFPRNMGLRVLLLLVLVVTILLSMGEYRHVNHSLVTRGVISKTEIGKNNDIYFLWKPLYWGPDMLNPNFVANTKYINERWHSIAMDEI